MRVLTFTSLFPNNNSLNLGSFVARRMLVWAEQYQQDWTIVAPVPFFPKLPFRTKWDKFSTISDSDNFHGRNVFHSKYMMLPYVGLRFQGRSMAFYSRRIIHEIQQKEGLFDLIDSHYVYPDGYAAMLFAQSMGIPFVVTARGTDINLYPEIPSIRSKIIKVLNSANAIIGVSQSLVDKMICLGAPPERCHVVSNGIDLDFFKLHPILGERKNSIRLLAVGNLVREKGFHVLLAAVSLLVKDNIDIDLVIVGEGVERNNLQEMACKLSISDRVEFLGYVPHGNLPEIYQNASFLCVPSFREGYPNVVMEALACGVPVVATPVGGIPEIIIDEINGILSLDNSPAAFVFALKKAFHRTWNYECVRNTVRDKDWKSVAKSINFIFNSLGCD